MDKEGIIQKILSHGSYKIYEDKILACPSKAYDNLVGYIKEGQDGAKVIIQYDGVNDLNRVVLTVGLTEYLSGRSVPYEEIFEKSFNPERIAKFKKNIESLSNQFRDLAKRVSVFKIGQ